MNVSVIGFGHIGSVISSVLSSKGCKVTGIDLNLNLVNEFKNGNSPISEPNLQDIILSSLVEDTLIGRTINNRLIKSAEDNDEN